MIGKGWATNQINTVEHPVIGVNLIREASKGVLVAFDLVSDKLLIDHQHIDSGATALNTEFLQDLGIAKVSCAEKSDQGRPYLMFLDRHGAFDWRNTVHICIMLVMPRKARPQQADVHEAIQRIDLFRQRSSLSVLSLARLCNVNQPSLARFLKGERKTVTSTARIVLKFIDEGNKRHNWHSHDTIPNEIENAIKYLWDGKPHSADLVASLIRALKPVLEIAAVRTSKRIGGGTS